MTKKKISISVDDSTLERISRLLATGRFRNRSHAFEYAVKVVEDG